MRNRQTYAILFILTALSGILSVAFSSLVGSIVINNVGRIVTNNVTAKSGSPNDIQAAVDAVHAAGGGTVYIPAGTFTFNPPTNGTAGIIIPSAGGISIIGAGIEQTILRQTVNAGVGSVMFSHSGQVSGAIQGNPIRISGISFVGYVVNESVTQNGGIFIQRAVDFRIDHCSFQDFDWYSISLSANTGGTYPLVNRGVIDHCTIDNPYKDRFLPKNSSAPQPWSLWGYGVMIVGDYGTFDPNIADYLGNYDIVTTYPTSATGQHAGPYAAAGYEPVPMPIYIENCNFSRCRHAISSNGAAYYVSRYNYFEKGLYGANDVHGNVGPPPWGGRGMETYSNIFNFTDESYSHSQDEAIEPRGGGGVCWNNTVILNPSYGTRTIGFGNDGEVAPYDVEQFYIWNNTAMWTNGTLTDFNSHFGTAPGSVFNGSYNANWGSNLIGNNTNYFLRAPDLIDDGFTYTPYTYPLPLTLTGST